MKEGYCKEQVMDRTGFHPYQCTRKEWKDGYCKQHHPETVAKRETEKEKRREEKKQNSSWYRLAEAEKKVARLEAENKALRKEILNLREIIKQG